MARRAVEPYDELEYREFSIPFHDLTRFLFGYSKLEIYIYIYLVQRVFPFLSIESLELSRELIRNFYFLLKNIGSSKLCIVSIEDYINFRGKIFISKNFSIAIFAVT